MFLPTPHPTDPATAAAPRSEINPTCHLRPCRPKRMRLARAVRLRRATGEIGKPTCAAKLEGRQIAVVGLQVSGEPRGLTTAASCCRRDTTLPSRVANSVTCSGLACQADQASEHQSPSGGGRAGRLARPAARRSLVRRWLQPLGREPQPCALGPGQQSQTILRHRKLARQDQG